MDFVVVKNYQCSHVQPLSDAVNVVVISFIVSPAIMLGLNQNVLKECCTFSAIALTEITEVKVQLAEWQVTLHVYL